MVSSGSSRHCLALFSLLLLMHTAAAARLNVGSSVGADGDFDVLTAIQTQVNTLNKNLEKLFTAIDDSQGPTQEPSPSSPTDEPPSPTDEPPSHTSDNQFKRLFISKNFLTLEADNINDDNCKSFENVQSTVEDAQVALDLVSEEQLSNTTLTKLQDSNNKLVSTIICVEKGSITFSTTDKESVEKIITAAQESGKAASETIDNIVSPPTQPPPEDDSGFKSATIALGVLLALAMVAVAGLAIYVSRQKSG